MSTEMRHKFFYDYSIKIYAIANICVLAGEKKGERSKRLEITLVEKKHF